MVQPGTNILLIADDHTVRAEIASALVQVRATVKAVPDGAAAVLLASSGWRPDVIVVDLLLSTRDSYVTFRALRQAFGVPIIVAAPSSMGVGEVDDVFPRPVDVVDLVRRIEERSGAPSPSIDVIRAGDLLLMPLTGKALLAGEELSVTSDEISLLACLAANAGQEVRKDKLRGVLRGVTADTDPRMVDVHLVRMMVKLESARSVHLRRTPSNDAYVLSVDSAASLAVPA